jgi:hypothetical protein|tara:strand:- start:252 stop:464 length:213 start_codon:yes stop_codon:yes gene_type:complete
MNTKKFSLIIEEIVLDKKLSYMDAIVDYCENNEMEIESAAKLVNTKIKESIKLEASDLNLLKEKVVKLPI